LGGRESAIDDLIPTHGCVDTLMIGKRQSQLSGLNKRAFRCTFILLKYKDFAFFSFTRLFYDDLQWKTG
jgi:hypothetical protein